MASCYAKRCSKRNQCSKYIINVSDDANPQLLDYSSLGSVEGGQKPKYMCGDGTFGDEQPYPLFEECISKIKHTTPYTLGDAFYSSSHDKVEKYIVSSMTIKSNGTWKIRLTSVSHRYVFEINESDIGKEFFTNEEESRKMYKKEHLNDI